MIAKIEMRGDEPVITVDGRVYPPMQMTTPDFTRDSEMKILYSTSRR